MPSPITDFEQNFRTSETLLKVYRLLESPDGPHSEHRLMQSVRELLMAGQEEELILLINDLFLGVVRQNADVNPLVFETSNLSLLLRQAVVAGCSALDVYFPTLLKTYLPQIIGVRERNFVPNDKVAKDFLKEFSIPLEDTLRIIMDAQPSKILGELLVEHLKRKTLSNSQGVAVTLLFFGVEDPWTHISHRLGQSREMAFRQFDELVNRRNDIVHRGDHSARDPNGPIQPIQHSWADSHIRFARSVVLACDEMATAQLKALGILAEVAVIPQPAKTEPANPEPAIPQPARPEPANPEPANPEPANPEPTIPQPARPEPANPESTNPEPTNPEPANPDG